MKLLLIVISLLASGVASAAGQSDSAVPTRIDVERGNGFMIWGAFGNAGGCVIANQIYVKIDHPQYKEVYAAALAAFAGKYKISAYIHSCESVSWYSIPANTSNIMSSNSVLSILD